MTNLSLAGNVTETISASNTSPSLETATIAGNETEMLLGCGHVCDVECPCGNTLDEQGCKTCNCKTCEFLLDT